MRISLGHDRTSSSEDAAAALSMPLRSRCSSRDHRSKEASDRRHDKQCGKKFCRGVHAAASMVLFRVFHTIPP